MYQGASVMSVENHARQLIEKAWSTAKTSVSSSQDGKLASVTNVNQLQKYINRYKNVE